MLGVLYKITNKLSGKIYVGQTIQPLEKRWEQHCYVQSHSSYLYSSIIKHGRDSFSIEELGTYNTLEDLNNAEEYYIDWFDCLAPNGYNLREGGGSHGKMSKDSRKKMSQNHRTKNGFKPPNFGKTMPIEFKVKMSNVTKGENNGMFGRHHSEETKRKISLTKLSKRK